MKNAMKLLATWMLALIAAFVVIFILLGCAGTPAAQTVSDASTILSGARSDVAAATQAAATQPGGAPIVQAGNKALDKIDQAAKVVNTAGTVLNAPTPDAAIGAIVSNLPGQYGLYAALGLLAFREVVSVIKARQTQQTIQTAITTPGTTPPPPAKP